MNTISFESDTFPTSQGDLAITFIGHGSLMMRFAGQVIHVDPFSRVADYSTLPAADLVLITHEHRDHLDPQALAQIRTAQTKILMTALCAGQLPGGIVMKNGDELALAGLRIRAVPAYNQVHTRENGQPFHPKGDGNGYLLDFGDLRVYIAGDTEDIPEMKDLPAVDVAFLPMNLPYTMTPEMVAAAVRSFHPRIVYPYHFGSTDAGRLATLLADTDVEVRLRSLS